MSILLIGDATETYTNESGLSVVDAEFDNTYQEGWQFPALASGTLQELRLYLTGFDGTITAVRLAIYADNAGAPGALLGSGTATGEPVAEDWVTVSDLEVELVEGTNYWMAVTAVGDGHILFNTAVASGGTPDWDTHNDAGNFWATWPTFDPDNDDSYADGPIGFQGLGIVSDDSPRRPSDLVWHVTGIWYPGQTQVTYYGRIADPSDDSYVDTLNDQSAGEVTFSIDGNAELATQLIGHAYARMLKVYDSGRLAYWGPYKLGRVDLAARTCTLNTVDPSLRLARHYLRRGDLVIGEGAVGGLNADNDDKSQVPVDHTGLRLLRDAALNTDDQTAEGYPDLGIIDGTNDYIATPFNLMGVQRGDQVWNTMQQLSQSLGPDFEFEPIENVIGAYARMNTYIRQGSDISDVVVFHFGTGKQNLESLIVEEGAKYTTHVHVLPRDQPERYRFTEPNPAAALETGPYVDWDATDYDSKDIPADKVEDVLRAYGKDIIAAYGRPLIQVTLTLPVDGPGVPRYGIDFKVGDTVGVAGRVVTEGATTPNVDIPVAPYRITSVRRKRDGEGIRSEITVVGDMVSALGDSTGGGSEA